VKATQKCKLEKISFNLNICNNTVEAALWDH
jgi:hypothetical protein